MRQMQELTWLQVKLKLKLVHTMPRWDEVDMPWWHEAGRTMFVGNESLLLLVHKVEEEGVREENKDREEV